jgi:hypothetical protein
MIGDTISHYKFQNSPRARSTSEWNFEPARQIYFSEAGGNPATPELVEGWRELKTRGTR